MRLLFDQNLSRTLVDRLRDEFPGSAHVARVNLDEATDREVWEFAKSEGLVIVSKDSDFRQLAFLYGPPPKVVWLRVGNADTNTIHDHLVEHQAVIEAFVENDEEALLILPNRMRI